MRARTNSSRGRIRYQGLHFAADVGDQNPLQQATIRFFFSIKSKKNVNHLIFLKKVLKGRNATFTGTKNRECVLACLVSEGNPEKGVSMLISESILATGKQFVGEGQRAKDEGEPAHASG